MNSREKKIRTGSKPVIYSIVAAFILLFASLIMQQSENPIAHFFANIYLFPFHLEFSKSFSVFIAAIISSIIALAFYSICSWNIKTKIGFYIVGTIVAYFVYTGVWYFVRTMGFALQDIFSIERIIPGIIFLLVSIFFGIILCSVHFSLTKEVYEGEFIEESEAYQADKRMENINNHKQYPKLKKQQLKIHRISNQEAIDRLYKDLEKVEKLINMEDLDLTLEATTNLRRIAETFTKQISIHNDLDLEKMVQYERVDYLYNQNYISNELYNVLTSIRKLGNRAAHEDNDRFGKNGILKLRRQLLDHIKEWVVNDQNEVVSKRNTNSKSTQTENTYEILLQIASLRDQGILTEEEFQKEKKKILSS